MKNLVKGLLTGAVIIILVTAGYASAGQNNSPGIPKEAAKKAIEHQTKGNILEDDGKLNDAITEYKESLKYNPEDVNTLFNLGVVYLKANSAKEAAAVFEKLTKAAPGDAEAYNLLGIAYRGAGREADAKKAWGKSLAINPNQPNVKKMMQYNIAQRQ